MDINGKDKLILTLLGIAFLLLVCGNCEFRLHVDSRKSIREPEGMVLPRLPYTSFIHHPLARRSIA